MQRPWLCLLLLTASLWSIAGGQLDSPGQGEDPIKSCFCQLEGVLEDCPCQAATVDAFNQNIHQQLSPLLHHPYFRYFQVYARFLVLVFNATYSRWTFRGHAATGLGMTASA